MQRSNLLRKLAAVALTTLTSTLIGAAAPPSDPAADAEKIILLDAGLDPRDPLAGKIAEAQARVKSNPHSAPQIERLGWLFVAEARVSNDPGFYKLAEQCAASLQALDPHSFDALLLKGHVLHSLHHFKEAEPLARDLAQHRGLAFDFGLLGDVEFDQGKIAEAVTAYQQMVNLRPDLESYSRVAQVRWITGDVPGAIQAMTLAGQAGSPLNAEPTSWTYSRLALLQLQTGQTRSARQSALFALQIQSNSAAALFALGRIQWADHETNSAIESLRRAAALNHLPESQWLLADLLREAGNTNELAAVSAQLLQRGVAEDPRSFSLYLATQGLQPELALDLARQELEVRGDVYTHDALAWALWANGKNSEALAEMSRALAEGTQDARLFLHAAVINQAAGEKTEASRDSQSAWNLRAMLNPSEVKRLTAVQSQLQDAAPRASLVP